MFSHPRHQREEKSFFTNDLWLAFAYINKWWTLKKINKWFIIRSPEERLVDLTDPYKIISHNNLSENLTIFMCTKYLIEAKLFNNIKYSIIHKFGWKNFDCYLLNWASLEAEIRIGWTDLRIKEFKKYYILELKKTDVRKKMSYEAEQLLWCENSRNIQTTRFDDKDIFCKNFYYQTKEVYDTLWYHTPSYHNLIFLKWIFNQIPQNYDMYVFVTSGCFKYMYDFINKNNYNKIILYNYHADIEETHKNIYLKKKIKDKKILIMDVTYSWTTLNSLQKIFEKEWAIVSKLALFPKSKLAIQNSDYSLIVNRFIDNKEIDIHDKNRIITAYKKLFSNMNNKKEIYNTDRKNHLFDIKMAWYSMQKTYSL